MGSISQRVVFDAPPETIYQWLMHSARHAKFTGAPAKMSQRVGGAFSAHGDYIAGINVELVPARRIVQAWRGTDWPDGVYSIATFELPPAGRGKTQLTFTQHGVPAKNLVGIRSGWREYYWEPLKRALRG